MDQPQRDRPTPWGVCKCGHGEGAHSADENKACLEGRSEGYGYGEACTCEKYVVAFHTFYLTSDEVVKLEALQSVGILILKNPDMVAFLANVPKVRMMLQGIIAKIAGHTSAAMFAMDPQGDERAAAGLNEAITIAKQFLSITKEVRKDAQSQGLSGT